MLPIINQYDARFFISLAFQIRVNKVSEILAFINNISDELKSGYPTLSFGINSLVKVTDNYIKIETPEELEITLKRLKNILEKEGLPLFERIKSVADLDREMNRENRPQELYTGDREIIGLISAVLNKNSQAKYWENYYRNKLKAKNLYTRNQFEKCVEHLNKTFSY